VAAPIVKIGKTATSEKFYRTLNWGEGIGPNFGNRRR